MSAAEQKIERSTEKLEILKTAIREASLSRLRLQSGFEGLHLESVDVSQRVFGHWMSLIMISSDPIKIVFKAHYMTKVARQLASKAYGRDYRSLSARQSSDFMKEYCNMVAGHLKRLLSHHNLTMGVSLPLVTRGFDALFMAPQGQDLIIEDTWALGDEHGLITCSLQIDLRDPGLLESLDLENGNNLDDDQGNVEFL